MELLWARWRFTGKGHQCVLPPSLSFTFDLFEFHRHKCHAHHQHGVTYCVGITLFLWKHHCVAPPPLPSTHASQHHPCCTGPLCSMSSTQVTTSHAKQPATSTQASQGASPASTQQLHGVVSSLCLSTKSTAVHHPPNLSLASRPVCYTHFMSPQLHGWVASATTVPANVLTSLTTAMTLPASTSTLQMRSKSYVIVKTTIQFLHIYHSHCKEIHHQRIKSEQRRHNKLGDSYGRLKDALPIANQKSGKVSLLNHATTHICYAL